MHLNTYIVGCLALVGRSFAAKPLKITCSITVIDFINMREDHGTIYECEPIDNPSDVHLIEYIPVELLEVNQEAIEQGEWIISFPSKFVNSNTNLVTLTDDDADKVTTVPPTRRLRKSTVARRGLRETRSVENALIVRVSTRSQSPVRTASAALSVLNSASQQFSACSNGDFRLVPWQRNGVNGVIEISVDNNTGSYDRNSIRWEAKEKLCLALGSNKNCNPSTEFGIDHVMYMVPTGTSGTNEYGFMYASLGGYFSVFGDPGGRWASRPSFEVESVLHEIAHNFHVGHAKESLASNPDSDSGESPEYGDDTGMMGSSFYLWGSNNNGNKRCFNGSNYSIMGWMKDKRVEVNPNTPTTVEIVGISSVNRSSQQIVYVKVLDLFLTYNLKRGFNSATREHADKLVVVQEVPWSAGSNTKSTELRAVLDNGQSFSYNGVSIIVCGKSDTGMSVAIGRGASCSTQQSHATDPPTASPTTGPSASPTVGSTASPTTSPTIGPTAGPTASPTAGPTVGPTAAPTDGPTASPTSTPTKRPTNRPTSAPTKSPTASPTVGPTFEPSASPSEPVPTSAPVEYDMLSAWQEQNSNRNHRSDTLKNKLKSSFSSNFIDKYLSEFNGSGNRQRNLKGSK